MVKIVVLRCGRGCESGHHRDAATNPDQTGKTVCQSRGWR
jgi:hypothetical protein